MTFAQFTHLIGAHAKPIVLLEGRREIPEEMSGSARRLGHLLAMCFPNMHFRSGNASGSDEAFAQGVGQHDPTRLELFIPYGGHRQAATAGALCVAADSLTDADRSIVAEATVAASPRNRGLVNSRSPRLQAKANYLLRDTLKVTGYGSGFAAPVAGIFYADPSDPMAGGTGHTIRVCQNHSVPVILQHDWLQWIPELETGSMACSASKYPKNNARKPKTL
ncbi:MAG: hypothetical protein WEB60_11855 [Terrimicrobiaceae bacterium]